jgi:hypothetical protein
MIINKIEKIYSAFPVIKFDNTYKVTYNNGKESFIPLDPANTDYQAIQEWIKEGGEVIDNPPSDNPPTE